MTSIKGISAERAECISHYGEADGNRIADHWDAQRVRIKENPTIINPPPPRVCEYSYQLGKADLLASGEVVLRKDVESEAKTLLDWWDEQKRLRKIKDEHLYNSRSGPRELQQDYYRADKAWDSCYHGQRVEMLERAIAILARFTTKPSEGCDE